MSNLPCQNVDDLDDRPEVATLFKTLKSKLPELQELLQQCSSHWGYEDLIYRFYHQSFKVYLLQESTLRIVNKLRALSPDRELNEWFEQIGPVRLSRWKTIKIGSALRDRFSKPFSTRDTF